MKMASRNIANMHLFLEMKNKFPDLPEDTLRNYVFLYAEDRTKCVSQLQKESKNHFHSSKKFPEFHLSENKTRHKKYQNKKIDLDQSQDSPNCNTVFLQNNIGNQGMLNNSDKPESVLEKQPNASQTSARSTINLPLKPSNLNIPVRYDVKSAPVLGNHNKPFGNIYQESSSSQTILSQTPELNNRMMFSTTKEHTIMPLETPNDGTDALEKPRHAVKLSITPSFPFPQQQMSVYTTAVSASTSQSSKPGRHTTSLNLQLQPHSADPYPVEISTVPTNVGNPCDFRDFGSHLQISVGAQGATFTALRLQRPQVAQSQHTIQLPTLEQASFNVSPSSSQPQDSKVYTFSTTQLRQVSDSSRKENIVWANEKYDNNFSSLTSDNEYQSGYSQISSLNPRMKLPSENVTTQSNFGNGFQASPGYVQAVKKHQLARLDLVREELIKEKVTCPKLKSEVNNLEQEIVRRQEKKSSFSYAELLKKIKEENRKLRIECNCLLMEYDISSKGQIPVGMTDEDFYSNIFTGPNDGLAFYSNEKKTPKEKLPPGTRKISAEEEEDEKNRWKCRKCTFANHPALEKCEMCELPKNSGYVEYISKNYSSSSHLRLVPLTEVPQRRAVGSVQISVTRRIPSNSKSVKLQLTHRIPR